MVDGRTKTWFKELPRSHVISRTNSVLRFYGQIYDPKIFLGPPESAVVIKEECL